MILNMAQIRLQKGTGIDGIVRDYVPDISEELGKLKVKEGISFLSGLFKKYKSAVHYGSHLGLLASITNILSPEKVNLFLQSTIGFEGEIFYAKMTGIFLNQLIINSYVHGGNNFVLVPPNSKALSFFGQELGYQKRGFDPNYEIYPLTREKPLMMEIRGDLKEHRFHRLKYTNLTVYGDVGILFGTMSEDSAISIHGKVTYGFFDQAKRCIITVDEMIDGFLSMYHGKEATQCTFRTSNPLTLETLLKNVPKDNRVVFLEADGTERVVKDF
jgi:hypothetical protein